MVTINLESLCNQNCVFCQRNKYFTTSPLSRKEIFRKLKLSKADDNEVFFTGGGEPTIREDLDEIFRMAKKLGYKSIILETNGIKLSNKEYLKKLISCGLTACIISLHSHKSIISDIITQAPGTFIKTVKALKNLRTLRIRVNVILICINRLNYRDIIDLIEFVRKIVPVNYFVLSFIRPIPGDHKSSILTPAYLEVKPYLIKTLNYCETNSIHISISDSCGIPLCFLSGYEELSTPAQIRINFGYSKYKKIVQLKDKIKPQKCKTCSLTKYCPGLNKSYYQLYGFTGIRPLHLSEEVFIQRVKRII